MYRDINWSSVYNGAKILEKKSNLIIQKACID